MIILTGMPELSLQERVIDGKEKVVILAAALNGEACCTEKRCHHHWRIGVPCNGAEELSLAQAAGLACSKFAQCSFWGDKCVCVCVCVCLRMCAPLNVMLGMFLRASHLRAGRLQMPGLS